MRHKRKSRLAAAVLAAAVLAGCGQAAASVSAAAGGSAAAGESAGAAAQPAYTGPLYQVSLLPMEEKLGQQGHFHVYAAGALDLSNDRGEIVYAEGLTEDKTYCYDYEYVDQPDGSYQIVRKYCDEHYEPLSVEGGRSFEAQKDGYRLFYYMPSSTGKNSSYELYGPDCDLVRTTADQYDISYMSIPEIILDTGLLMATDRASGADGFLNLYTGEWLPMPDGCTPAGASMYLSVATEGFYTEGLVPAVEKEPVRIHNPGSAVSEYAEYNVAGFLDESGAFAFKFEEQPQFAGKVINGVTGFLDGTCIVSGREPGAYTVDTRLVDLEPDLFQRDFFWRIDTRGNPVEEVDFETMKAFRAQVLEANGHIEENVTNCRQYYKKSIRIADGLTLATVNPITEDTVVASSELDGCTLTDANGHEYPLDVEIQQAFVGDDGTVWLDCRRQTEPGNPDNDYPSVWYELKYEWIAPEGYTLPDGQEKELSAGDSQRITQYHDQVQEILVIADLCPAQNPVFTVQTGSATRTYAATVDDTMYMEGDDPMTEGTVFFQLYTLAPEPPVITVEWTNSDGTAHRGRYDPDAMMIVEDETV